MKRIFIAIFTAAVVLIMTGCNKNLIDTVYQYDKAMIMLPNGEVIDGQIESWTDYEDGDQIQVTINGKTYLVHSENICLIAGSED